MVKLIGIGRYFSQQIRMPCISPRRHEEHEDTHGVILGWHSPVHQAISRVVTDRFCSDCVAGKTWRGDFFCEWSAASSSVLLLIISAIDSHFLLEKRKFAKKMCIDLGRYFRRFCVSLGDSQNSTPHVLDGAPRPIPRCLRGWVWLLLFR